jgi:hypothetical protein
MEKSIDQALAEFKQAKREYIDPNMEKAIDRALAEFKEAQRRCLEPTSEKPMAQLQHEHAEFEAKRLAYNACIDDAQRPRRRIARGSRRTRKFYQDREAMIEKQRLAKLREWEEWQVKWRDYQFFGGPKPAPLDME